MELFKLFGILGLKGVRETEKQLDDVTNRAEQSSNRMGSAFKKIGTAVAAAFAVERIKTFGVAVVQASAEVAAEQSAFTQIMGEYTDEAAAKVQKIADATGMVDTRLTPYMTSMTAKFKGLGYDVDKATDFAARGLNLAADASAFWDKSLDESMSHLNSFINGSYEGGEAIGLFANDTQMAAYAVEKGIVKSTAQWAKLDEKTKQATRLEYAENMMKQSGATGQAAKESGQYANVMANLAEQWRQFKAQVGEPLLQNIVIPAMKRLGDYLTNTLIPAVTKLKDWVVANKNQLIEWAKQIGIAAGVMMGLVGAWKAGLIIQKVTQAVQKARVQLALYKLTVGASTTATTLWTAAQRKLNRVLKANPIGIIIMLIAGLVALLVTAYKRNENFRKAVNKLRSEIKSGLKPAFESLKPLLSAIIKLFKSVRSLISALVIPIFKKIVSTLTFVIKAVTPILSALLKIFNAVFKPIVSLVTTVIDVIGKIAGAIAKAVKAVSDGIGKIKNLFKFKWEWPKLKMPHFNLKGKFSLKPPSVPKIGVDWYKDGGIFDKPTLFPTASGIKGVGEAGAEAVAPIDKLTGYVQSAVQQETSGLSYQIDKLINMLATYFPDIINNMQRDVVLNDGVLVGRLAPQLNRKLADIQRANERGR